MKRALANAKEEILRVVASARTRVFRQTDLTAILRDHRRLWGLGQNVSFGDFVGFLSAEGELRVVDLPSEGAYPPFHRYVWGDVSAFELAVALKKHSYLSHSTAVFLHGLTDQIPQTLYVNAEQSAKPRPVGTLTQDALDRAFRAPQRSSKYVFIYETNRFVLLSGKNTGRYGVIDRTPPTGASVPITNLERTLVDITVRPVYGGGVHQVQAAFRSAAEHLSMSKLVATLEALDYVYPYHQALGFYLERAGVSKTRLKPLRQLGLDYDFYLAHGIKDPAHDSSWRIFHPKRL